MHKSAAESGLGTAWVSEKRGLKIFLIEKIFIGVQLLYIVMPFLFFNQQSASVIYIHTFPPFWVSFPFRSPQGTEQNSLCYTVINQFSILYIKIKQMDRDPMDCMEFSRPEHWSGQPFPSPGDLPLPGIEPRSPALQVDSLPAEPPGKPF